MNHDRALRFAVLAIAARVGHLLGDYGAQTNADACCKAAPGYNIDPKTGQDNGTPSRESWKANQRHCATYHAALIATVAATAAATGVRVRPGRAVAAVAFSWASHAVIDRRWPVKRFMAATGSGDWYDDGKTLVDQMLHEVCLLAAAGIASG
jgi:hypothetical protein